MPRFFIGVVALWCALPTFSAENRFNLFDCSDAEHKRGLTLALENKVDGDVLSIDSVRLALTVGDGSRWHRIVSERKFLPSERVKVRVRFSARGAELIVDGVAAGETPGELVAATVNDAKVAETEKWHKTPTPYRVHQEECRVSAGGRQSTIRCDQATQSAALFEFPLARTLAMPVVPATELIVETEFRIEPITPSDVTGAVDRFGQAASAQWPDKVTQDADLERSRIQEEETLARWARPKEWDNYGGLKSAPWHEKPSGFYRVTKRNERWWLVSPEGNPLFYTGLCVAPALIWAQTPTLGREYVWQELPLKTGVTAELWSVSPWGDGEPGYFSQHAWNLIRKFGPQWRAKATEECGRRLAAWGFSGLGKFCDDDLPGWPRVETPKLGGIKPLVRHIDVFDPAACARVRDYLASLLTPKRDDPRILGFSVGNEYDGIFTTDEIRQVLRDHSSSAVAQAIRAAVHLSEPATEDEIEQARRFYAEAYYAFLHRTVKELAPNHLYFGFWITPGWWQNESDWDMITRHCDVVGYDKYALAYGGDDGVVLKISARHDRPTLVGEFSFPAWYGGARGFCRYSTFVETDRDAGELYAKYLAAAASDPRCVGAMWFQYRDEPITGWGGEGGRSSLVRGESYAEGLVDITDRPKWDLVTRVREANLRATRDRLSE